MTAEALIQSRIRLAVGDHAPHARLFRNVVTDAWVGRVVRHTGQRVLLEHAHRIQAGLIEGSADLIGWTTVIVSQDMVGKPIAVFTSGEVKRPKGSRFEPGQLDWLKAVRDAGGFADVIRSEDDALRLVRAK